MTTPPRICPACSGAWLYSLTFDHTNTCALRNLDDGTIANDHDWAVIIGRPYYRAATTTEQTLATALGWTGQPDGGTQTVQTVVVPRTWSIRLRLLRVGDNGALWSADTTDSTVS